MHTRFYILFIGSLLVRTLFGTVAVAQGNCDESIAIPEATKRYATGNFDDVFALLAPCTEKGFSETGRVQALKILSMTYLAIDSMQQSSKSISQLLALNPAFEPDFSASPRYKALFRYVRESQEQIVQVTSVSKKAENILYVPATIMVLTGKDFAQRGYQDLEQVLHDLPGFDVMKGNGVGYSYFYQRGYRSISNDRTLMLIDGVEENDLVSNHILISPQYALSNIERVEVIYGPASTLYGANAFVGVINIITKNYRDQPGPSRQIGVTAHARAGGLNTHFMDGVIWGRTSDVAFSITGRVFHSDERDLSGYSQWNFDSRTAADYTGQLDITGTDANGNYRAQNYLNTSKLLTRYPNSNLYNVTYAPGTNTATALTLTQQGAQKAATLDNNLFGNTFNGQPVRFSNTKNDWMIRAKLEFKDLTISFLNWKTNEGATPWYTNKTTLSTEGSPRWITQNRAFSITYSKPFNDKFQLVNISSYLLHEINGNTNLVTYNGYYNSKLSFLELAKDSIPKATAIYQYRLSSQLRNELRLFWSPAYNVDVSSGIEVRSGQIQVNYLNSTRPYADETGSVVSNAALGGGNNFRTTDMGIYSQVTYRPTKDLKLVGGVRVDNNRVRSHNGYGTVANPRFAAIYNYSKFIFKAIYAEAFKDASFLQKYGTTATRTLTNPGLSPERVKNLDVSAYFQATKQLSANIVGYYATYSNAVGVAQVQLETGGTTQQFQALGRREIWGIQGEATYKATRLNAWMNFTYTNPVDQDTDQRLSDVADYMVNAGGDYQILPKLHLYVSGNYVSARKTGAGTSGSFNPQQTFPAFFVMNSNLTYHNLVSGLNLQLSVNNLLDNDYSVPGVREADNTLYTNIYPQDRRYVSFGIFYTLTPKESVQK
ncbi:TonB-dependent receptor plug domain-containing protein [Spirosoma jeollabukense]